MPASLAQPANLPLPRLISCSAQLFLCLVMPLGPECKAVVCRHGHDHADPTNALHNCTLELDIADLMTSASELHTYAALSLHIEPTTYAAVLQKSTRQIVGQARAVARLA